MIASEMRSLLLSQIKSSYMKLHLFSKPASSGLLSGRCFLSLRLKTPGQANSRVTDREKSLCPSNEGNAVARAFAVAYLLTADAEQAEAAVTEAAECWNPEIDSEEALVLFSAVTAARMLRRGPDLVHQGHQVSRFPRELAQLAGFDALSRGCFALRMLLRLPLPVCAGMLGIGCDEAEERLCAMLRELPARVEN